MRLRRVYPNPHPDIRRCFQSALSRNRRRHGISRAIEDDEEGITLSLNDCPTVLRERLAKNTTMLCPQVTPSRAVLTRQLSRSFNVTEEEGGQSRGKAAHHPAIVSRLRRPIQKALQSAQACACPAGFRADVC